MSNENDVMRQYNKFMQWKRDVAKDLNVPLEEVRTTFLEWLEEAAEAQWVKHRTQIAYSGPRGGAV